MKIIIFFLSITFITISCNSSSKKESPTKLLHNQIMAVHDEVMPKTAEIHRTIKNLKSEKTSVTANNTALLKMFDKQVADLEAADESMGDWMANYKTPDFNDTSEGTIVALDMQLIKIEEVKAEMLSALIQGTKFFDHIHKSNPANVK